MSKGNLLVIDDEKDLVELIRYNFEQEGFKVIGAADGESGLSLAFIEKPDLIILDLMLPGMDGLEVCRQLRDNNGTSRVPIVMLTAKTSESDRVVGLEFGADDYVSKPFSPRELSARVKAVLRRSAEFGKQPANIVHGSLFINPTGHQVRCKDKTVDLTPTEYRLLHFLATHPDFVYSRDALIDGALGRNVTVLGRTIDVHVMSLRRKLGECGNKIETIRGFGYKFRKYSEG
jgi:two-component system, OmpR family, alkaline phosphatase synthesis response regulator PhoP